VSNTMIFILYCDWIGVAIDGIDAIVIESNQFFLNMLSLSLSLSLV
jgi:hypothetical protein